MMMQGFGALLATAAVAASANGAIITYTAILDGPSEAPPNASPGTGFAIVDIDRDAHTMRVRVEFSGLVGNVTACHIHAPTAVAGTGTVGVATPTPSFPGFPHGGTSGMYDMTFDMTLASSYNAAFLNAPSRGGNTGLAEADFWLYLHQGRAYVNVHSNVFPGGEIRGFLVPSPGTLGLIGLGALCAARRRR